ncbi:MAG: hypothetical protein U5R49_19925 [Deltaproteobacteria bacterium]|nr:hypothetical protein [Deltaproteobacteria bacterium]
MPKGTKRPSSKAKRERQPQNQTVTEADFGRIEFHRHGLALFPAPGDKRPGIAMLVEDASSGMRHGFCTCVVSAKQTCPHLKKLKKLHKALPKRLEGKTLETDFRDSVWYRLAEILGKGPPIHPRMFRSRRWRTMVDRFSRSLHHPGRRCSVFMRTERLDTGSWSDAPQ